MGGHTSLITGAASDGKKLYTFSMDGKVCIWNAETLVREGDMKDIVNGGILSGTLTENHLVVTGNDMVTKLVSKNK
jgi:WD40 repeat protein